MASIVPFITAASAIFSAVGALQQGRAASQAAAYNSQINQQNAVIAQQQAEQQAGQQARENYLRLGAIRAAQGTSGGTGDAGSVLDVLADAGAQGELERQNILYQGQLSARGYQNTAALDVYSGERQRNVGYLKAGSELLTGGVNTYNAVSRLKRT